MNLVTLTKKEFKKFADKHEQITFHQTEEWANLKKNNGWDAHYVGLKDNNKIVAAALLLAKTVPFVKKKMFYSPRGFLIDYKDYDLIKTFTEEIKKYAKDNGAIFIKIDPYLEYVEHDNNGDIVENGFNNKDAVENLKKLGYKHYGFNLMQDTLQPRWMHVIETKNKSLDDVMKDMESKTRQILRKNEKCGITTREISRDELPLFKDIMQHTSDRREFVDRPLSYYESMWDALHDSGILKILLAEIDFNEYKKNTEEELKQEHGEKTLLGGILFLVYGNEVLSLYGGSTAKLMQFQSAYTVHFAGVKMAVENNYDKYNFYGITGDFRKENPLYGLFLFKKSFGGHVSELIGEFDLIISPFWYNTYNIAFSLYHGLKNLKKKLTK